ncbi:hypothetical protein O1L60_01820 [Streptomyces diastatochromogenes]|nr:hypothetical protein [Streptomyces diastatochromogenes]
MQQPGHALLDQLDIAAVTGGDGRDPAAIASATTRPKVSLASEGRPRRPTARRPAGTPPGP